MKKLLLAILLSTIVIGGFGNEGFAITCDEQFATCMIGCPTSTIDPSYQNCADTCSQNKQLCEQKGTKYTDCLKTCKGKDGNSNTQQFCECKCAGGIVLNTDFPFLGRCIPKTSDGTVLTAVSGTVSKIFMSLILTAGFVMVIWGGVQVASGQVKEGTKKIQNVVIAFAVLGSLGIILRLINPNFFK